MSFEFEPTHAAEMPALEVDTLLDLPLRVWAELGRTHMSAAHVVGMGAGAIIDLDRLPEDPADIYVNGRLFGAGRLLLVDGEWAVRIESLEPQGAEIEQTSSGGSNA